MRKCERKSMSGLFKRRGVWRIDKVIDGKRIQESCKTGDLAEAERLFVHKLEEMRQAEVYGVRPKRIFREAAIKYLTENQHKRSIRVDAWILKVLDPFIGDLLLDSVHIGTLQPFIEARRKDGVKSRTINCGLQTVRHILKLAESEWMDEYGLTWLDRAPKIKLLDERGDKSPAYPMNWEEQNRLFAELPPHLKQMAVFAVNTGCRDKEICRLRWEWEVPLPELNLSVFIVPGEWVKNADDRLIVLNENAKAVIEEMRGINAQYVFTFRNQPIKRMMNSAWKKARQRANLARVRVHDLKHTFGRRLRAAGVSYEDRQDLLGHRSSRITTHYSAAEIESLVTAANKVCRNTQSSPILTILRRQMTRALPSSTVQTV